MTKRTMFSRSNPPPEWLLESIGSLADVSDDVISSVIARIEELVQQGDDALAEVCELHQVKPRAVAQLLQIATYLAHQADFNDLPVASAVPELGAFGVPPEVLHRLEVLTQALEAHVPGVEAQRRRVIAGRSAIPVLLSLDVLTDLRAVYAQDVTVEGSPREAECLAVTEWLPVAVFEFMTELNQEQETFALQAPLDTLKHIRRLVDVAVRRLEQAENIAKRHFSGDDTSDS